MRLWAVIPVKPFDEGKTRLAPVLGRRERCALNRTFLADTMRTALCVFPPQQIVVVSRSHEALAMARAQAVRALPEDSIGLNAALEAGAQLARDGGADGVLSLSADLPLLTPDDLHAMLEAPAGVAIASDLRGSGTNALLFRPPGLIAYAYGADSFAAHSGAADAAHVALTVVNRQGLQFDIDTPDDWQHWQSCRHSDAGRRHGLA